MSEGYIVQPQAGGALNVRYEGANGIVSRYVLAPGAYTDAATWAATDLTMQPQVVQDAASATWTTQVVVAYQTAHPFIPAPAFTDDQKRVIAILANPRRQALLAAALQTDDAGIISYIEAQVTDLASAKKMLENIALILLAVVRN